MMGSRFRHVLVALTLACVLGCAASEATPDADTDGGTTDADATPDPCPVDAVRLHVIRDADGDGFGVLQGAEAMGCVRNGYIPFPADRRLDCDDENPAAHPDAPQSCDFDADGTPGVDDCDDHNRLRAPTKVERCNGFDDDCDGLVDDADEEGRYSEDANWGLDEDGDGYPSELLFSCTDPGGGYVRWGLVSAEHLDCAPLDAAVHPFQRDDCATETDANCDGVFTPVYASEDAGRTPRVDIANQIMSAGPTDAPTYVPISIQEYGEVIIDLCPGTYRAHLDLVDGSTGFKVNNRFTIRGHGASPADVVLDAGQSGRNVTVPATFGWEWGPYAVRAELENMTLIGGRATDGLPGGCVVQAEGVSTDENDGWLILDRVVFRDCESATGGAVAVQPNSALTMTDVVFEDTQASVRGGAIFFEGTTLTMTRGSFTGTRAPAMSGGAIAAVLGPQSNLTLQSVDLGAVSNDISVTSSSYSAQRNLGAGADLTCSSTACTP